MWIFDLDHTLYPPARGLLAAVDDNIAQYIARRTGMSIDESHRLRRRLWQKWGTTARGMRDELNWNLDPGSGQVEDRTDLEQAYSDLLDQDYD